MDIAGAKHDVHVSMTSKGAPGPLSFMQGGKIPENGYMQMIIAMH